MPEKADDPPDFVTAFIRRRIELWEESGKLLKDLASNAGLAKSMPSQIKAETSAASFYSAGKLARPLGYRDLPHLVNEAWAWWHSSDPGQHAAPASAPTPVEEAIRIGKDYGVTTEHVAIALQRCRPENYPHKDTLWWLKQFEEARSLDADRQPTPPASPRAKKRRRTDRPEVSTLSGSAAPRLRRRAG